jgi:hypothetical protein
MKKRRFGSKCLKRIEFGESNSTYIKGRELNQLEMGTKCLDYLELILRTLYTSKS